MRQEQMMPHAEQSIKFWSELWDHPVYHDRNPHRIITIEKVLECVAQQGNINIIKEDVSIRLTKMPNWKAPDPDGLHRFWLKKLTSLHQAIIVDCIQTRDFSKLMTESQPFNKKCKKWEYCLQLQTNSLLESPLEITDWYY